jgi:hypothetical protein
VRTAYAISRYAAVTTCVILLCVCCDSMVDSNHLPLVEAIGPRVVKINVPVDFSGVVTDEDGYIKLYEWDFDGDSVID